MLRSFRLLQPASLAEASSMLEEYGDEARLYAGGTALLMLMNRGVLRIQNVIDIKRIPDLNLLQCDQDGSLILGATVTHRELETSALVKERFPLVAEMEKKVANVRVRNVGTIGGNLALAEPQSDPATLLLLFDADVLLQSNGKNRRAALTEFFTGPYETLLEPSELLSEIRIPQFPEGMKGAYMRWGMLEWPSVSIGVSVKLGQDETIAAVRMAVGSMSPVPTRLAELERSIEGMELGEACRHIENSHSFLEERLQPTTDLYGSSDYKLHLAKVLMQRALRQAAGRDNV